MTTKKTVLITGATGKQGGATARALAGKGFNIRAMTRKPDGDVAKAVAKATGAELVSGDLNDEASLKNALKGAWGVFAVQNTWEARHRRRGRTGQAHRQAGPRGGCAALCLHIGWVCRPQDWHSAFRQQISHRRHRAFARVSLVLDS
jgi:hypothetical protein